MKRQFSLWLMAMLAAMTVFAEAPAQTKVHKVGYLSRNQVHAEVEAARGSSYGENSKRRQEHRLRVSLR